MDALCAMSQTIRLRVEWAADPLCAQIAYEWKPPAWPTHAVVRTGTAVAFHAACVLVVGDNGALLTMFPHHLRVLA